MTLLSISLVLTLLFPPSSFKEKQLAHERVKNAYTEKELLVKEYFRKKQIDYASFELFIRAFKQEGKVEVWVKEKNKEKFTLLITYDFCMLSGELGPKRKEGDLQVPEGVYYINHFNPVSNFHLSLGINYPNASDNILSDKNRPGSSIYIHGNCVSIGCIPITDEKIKELYVMAVEARTNGQEKIPVHIFPTRLTSEGFALLKKNFSENTSVLAFWENLQSIYDDFETSKQLKPVKINSKGQYSL